MLMRDWLSYNMCVWLTHMNWMIALCVFRGDFMSADWAQAAWLGRFRVGRRGLNSSVGNGKTYFGVQKKGTLHWSKPVKSSIALHLLHELLECYGWMEVELGT